jgi:hypothetical protein
VTKVLLFDLDDTLVVEEGATVAALDAGPWARESEACHAHLGATSPQISGVPFGAIQRLLRRV